MNVSTKFMAERIISAALKGRLDLVEVLLSKLDCGLFLIHVLQAMRQDLQSVRLIDRRKIKNGMMTTVFAVVMQAKGSLLVIDQHLQIEVISIN